MVPALVVFVFVTGAVLGLYLVARALASWISTRRVEQRLREVSRISERLPPVSR